MTRLIDLSISVSGQSEGFTVRRQEHLPIYLGHECYAYDLAIQSHCGTYYETSSHVFRNGQDTHKTLLEDLFLPGVCLRVQTPEQCITADDLEKAATGLTLPSGAGLLIHTGYRQDKPFFYFSRDAARWMAQKKIKLMGSDTEKYDNGFDKPTGFFVELFEADIAIIANLQHIDQLPRTGFELIVLPLPIEGICTVPCRVAARI